MDAWLKAAVDYIPSWLDYQMRQTGQPGCVIAIAHKGRIVLEKAFGVADVSTGRALTPRHRLRAASHSKSLHRGRGDEAPGSVYFAWTTRRAAMSTGCIPPWRRQTLTQLLSHSAGMIRDGAEAEQFLDRRPFVNERELRAALAEPLTIEPSTRFKYSNHAFGLVGLVMEAVTGEPYREWDRARDRCAERAARDLARRTGARARTGGTGAHAQAAARAQACRARRQPDPLAIAPAGGFVSTAADLALFFASLDPAAKRSVLSPQAVAK